MSSRLPLSLQTGAGAGAGAGGGAGAERTEELDAALPPEAVDELLRSQRVRDWLHGLGELAPGE